MAGSEARESGVSSGMRRVLACVALSPRLRDVMAQAQRLAEVLEGEVRFLHVGEASDRALAQLRSASAEAGIPDSSGDDGATDGDAVLVRSGEPSRVICRTATEIGADLIFLGALEEEGLIQGVIGSVARRVARRAPCSVLLFTGEAPQDGRYKRIVAAVRYDGSSEEMLRLAAWLARRSESEALHVVHEYDPFSAGMRTISEVEDFDTEREARARAAEERSRLADFLEGFELSGLNVSTACLRGREGVEIVRYAERHRADLLLAPRPARRLTIWDRFFGHRTELVLHRLPCSLLLYREPRPDGR